MVASGGARFLTSLMVREAEVMVAPGDEHHVMCDDHSVAPIGAWHSGVTTQLVSNSCSPQGLTD